MQFAVNSIYINHIHTYSVFVAPKTMFSFYPIPYRSKWFLWFWMRCFVSIRFFCKFCCLDGGKRIRHFNWSLKTIAQKAKGQKSPNNRFGWEVNNRREGVVARAPSPQILHLQVLLLLLLLLIFSYYCWQTSLHAPQLNSLSIAPWGKGGVWQIAGGRL